MVQNGRTKPTPAPPARTDKKIGYLLRVIFMTDILKFFGQEKYHMEVMQLQLQKYQAFKHYADKAKGQNKTNQGSDPLNIPDANLLILIWTEYMLNFCPLSYMKDFFPKFKKQKQQDRTICDVHEFKFYTVEEYQDLKIKEPYIPPMLLSTFFELVKIRKIKFNDIWWSFQAEEDLKKTQRR
jgi:hypothetical protein